ncbi:BTB And Kelch [Ancylostoma duodenale]|uniref:BTB And Kelch n=1 Tax=Ancylostoma duodenale TaxID=51022 RepID=A0A0C2FNZ8_9BILA|nr:BTB And Kelch [Ancylostoma duodenale]
MFKFNNSYARTLQIVTEKCATFICEHLLDVDNALSLRTIFLSVGCRSAAEDVGCFVEKNFALISHSDKFLELFTEYLVELLSKDELNVVSEEEVFNAAMRWIEHSPERTNVLERVLSCVRLHLLDKKVLVDKVARHPSILCSSRCREMVDEVKDFHLVRGRKPKSSLHTRPRRYNASGFAIIVVVIHMLEIPVIQEVSRFQRATLKNCQQRSDISLSRRRCSALKP